VNQKRRQKGMLRINLFNPVITSSHRPSKKREASRSILDHEASTKHGHKKHSSSDSSSVQSEDIVSNMNVGDIVRIYVAGEFHIFCGSVISISESEIVVHPQTLVTKYSCPEGAKVQDLYKSTFNNPDCAPIHILRKTIVSWSYDLFPTDPDKRFYGLPTIAEVRADSRYTVENKYNKSGVHIAKCKQHKDTEPGGLPPLPLSRVRW
jgi:hypothetical protein